MRHHGELEYDLRQHISEKQDEEEDYQPEQADAPDEALLFRWRNDDGGDRLRGGTIVTGTGSVAECRSRPVMFPS